MDIQHLKGAAFAVYVSGDELREEHIDPADVTVDDTERILASAFSRLGRQREEQVFLELFPGRDDLLLFVRPARTAPLFFTFDGLEALVAAADSWHGDAASSLWYIDGRYILAVWPWDAPDDCHALLEFGESLDKPPEYEPFLSEHGRILASPDALGSLRKAFCRKS